MIRSIRPVARSGARRGATAVLLVAAGLLVASCGSSGSSAASDGGERQDPDNVTTTATPSAAPAADEVAAAAARARTVQLTAAELPSGWAFAPATVAADRLTGACVPVLDDDRALASSAADAMALGALGDGAGAQLVAETVVFADEDAAAEAVSAFEDDEVVACLDEAAKAVLSEITGRRVEGELASAPVELGTDQGATVSAPYVLLPADGADDGAPLPSSVAVLAFRTGDVATFVTIASVGDGFDPTTVEVPVRWLAEQQATA